MFATHLLIGMVIVLQVRQMRVRHDLSVVDVDVIFDPRNPQRRVASSHSVNSRTQRIQRVRRIGCKEK